MPSIMKLSSPSVAHPLAQAIRVVALPCLTAIAFGGCAAPYEDEPLTPEEASTTGESASTGESEDELALDFRELSQASDVGGDVNVLVESKWAFPAEELWNIDAYISIEDEASASTPFEYMRRGYFAGTGLNFEISLQTRGGNKGKKLAVFSVQKAASAQPGGSGSWCKYFSGANGKGRSCQMYFDWQAGRPYRFRIWRGEANRWMAFVRDEVTHKEVYLGSIEAPGAENLLPWLKDVTKNQEPLHGCGGVGTRAVFSQPTGNNGTFQGLLHSAATGEQCFGHTVSVAHGWQAVHELVPGCGQLQVGQELLLNQSIRSCNGLYTLTLDRNVVLSGPSGMLWEGGELPWDITATKLVMQGDGNLVLYLMDVPLWATDTDGHPGAVLQLRDNGNLVMMHDGKVIWTSNTAQ